MYDLCLKNHYEDMNPRMRSDCARCPLVGSYLYVICTDIRTYIVKQQGLLPTRGLVRTCIMPVHNTYIHRSAFPHNNLGSNLAQHQWCTYIQVYTYKHFLTMSRRCHGEKGGEGGGGGEGGAMEHPFTYVYEFIPLHLCKNTPGKPHPPMLYRLQRQQCWKRPPYPLTNSDYFVFYCVRIMHLNYTESKRPPPPPFPQTPPVLKKTFALTNHH